MATQKLWKLVVEAPLEHHEIERAVADVPAATDPASAIRGVELQRIDVVGGRSFVFASGSAEAAAREMSQGGRQGRKDPVRGIERDRTRGQRAA